MVRRIHEAVDPVARVGRQLIRRNRKGDLSVLGIVCSHVIPEYRLVFHIRHMHLQAVELRAFNHRDIHIDGLGDVHRIVHLDVRRRQLRRLVHRKGDPADLPHLFRAFLQRPGNQFIFSGIVKPPFPVSMVRAVVAVPVAPYAVPVVRILVPVCITDPDVHRTRPVDRRDKRFPGIQRGLVRLEEAGSCLRFVDPQIQFRPVGPHIFILHAVDGHPVPSGFQVRCGQFVGTRHPGPAEFPLVVPFIPDPDIRLPCDATTDRNGQPAALRHMAVLQGNNRHILFRNIAQRIGFNTDHFAPHAPGEVEVVPVEVAFRQLVRGGVCVEHRIRIPDVPAVFHLISPVPADLVVHMDPEGRGIRRCGHVQLRVFRRPVLSVPVGGFCGQSHILRRRFVLQQERPFASNAFISRRVRPYADPVQPSGFDPAVLNLQDQFIVFDGKPVFLPGPVQVDELIEDRLSAVGFFQPDMISLCSSVLRHPDRHPGRVVRVRGYRIRQSGSVHRHRRFMVKIMLLRHGNRADLEGVPPQAVHLAAQVDRIGAGIPAAEPGGHSGAVPVVRLPHLRVFILRVFMLYIAEPDLFRPGDIGDNHRVLFGRHLRPVHGEVIVAFIRSLIHVLVNQGEMQRAVGLVKARCHRIHLHPVDAGLQPAGIDGQAARAAAGSAHEPSVVRIPVDPVAVFLGIVDRVECDLQLVAHIGFVIHMRGDRSQIAVVRIRRHRDGADLVLPEVMAFLVRLALRQASVGVRRQRVIACVVRPPAVHQHAAPAVVPFFAPVVTAVFRNHHAVPFRVGPVCQHLQLGIGIHFEVVGVPVDRKVFDGLLRVLPFSQFEPYPIGPAAVSFRIRADFQPVAASRFQVPGRDPVDPAADVISPVMIDAFPPGVAGFFVNPLHVEINEEPAVFDDIVVRGCRAFVINAEHDIVAPRDMAFSHPLVQDSELRLPHHAVRAGDAQPDDVAPAGPGHIPVQVQVRIVKINPLFPSRFREHDVLIVAETPVPFKVVLVAPPVFHMVAVHNADRCRPGAVPVGNLHMDIAAGEEVLFHRILPVQRQDQVLRVGTGHRENEFRHAHVISGLHAEQPDHILAARLEAVRTDGNCSVAVFVNAVRSSGIHEREAPVQPEQCIFEPFRCDSRILTGSPVFRVQVQHQVLPCQYGHLLLNLRRRRPPVGLHPDPLNSRIRAHHFPVLEDIGVHHVFAALPDAVAVVPEVFEALHFIEYFVVRIVLLADPDLQRPVLDALREFLVRRVGVMGEHPQGLAGFKRALHAQDHRTVGAGCSHMDRNCDQFSRIRIPRVLLRRAVLDRKYPYLIVFIYRTARYRQRHPGGFPIGHRHPVAVRDPGLPFPGRRDIQAEKVHSPLMIIVIHIVHVDKQTPVPGHLVDAVHAGIHVLRNGERHIPVDCRVADGLQRNRMGYRRGLTVKIVSPGDNIPCNILAVAHLDPLPVHPALRVVAVGEVRTELVVVVRFLVLAAQRMEADIIRVRRRGGKVNPLVQLYRNFSVLVNLYEILVVIRRSQGNLVTGPVIEGVQHPFPCPGCLGNRFLRAHAAELPPQQVPSQHVVDRSDQQRCVGNAVLVLPHHGIGFGNSPLIRIVKLAADPGVFAVDARRIVRIQVKDHLDLFHGFIIVIYVRDPVDIIACHGKISSGIGPLGIHHAAPVILHAGHFRTVVEALPCLGGIESGVSLVPAGFDPVPLRAFRRLHHVFVIPFLPLFQGSQGLRPVRGNDQLAVAVVVKKCGVVGIHQSDGQVVACSQQGGITGSGLNLGHDAFHHFPGPCAVLLGVVNGVPVNTGFGQDPFVEIDAAARLRLSGMDSVYTVLYRHHRGIRVIPFVIGVHVNSPGHIQVLGQRAAGKVRRDRDDAQPAVVLVLHHFPQRVEVSAPVA